MNPMFVLLDQEGIHVPNLLPPEAYEATAEQLPELLARRPELSNHLGAAISRGIWESV